MADLASIGAALGSVKTLWDLARNAQDAQLAMKISAELSKIQGQLIEVQQQILAIQQENQQLRNENGKYKSLVQHHSVMWKLLPDGKEDGTFCPVCIADGREMRLLLVEKWDQKGDCWCVYCPQGHEQSRYTDEAPGPYYDIRKSLAPENYFTVRGASGSHVRLHPKSAGYGRESRILC